MEFVDLKEFLDDVLPEAPGCSTYMALDKLRWAAIEFCKQTGVSTETTAELDLDAGESELTLPTPSADVRVWQVLWMKTTHGPIDPADRRFVVERGGDWDGLQGDWPLSYVRIDNKTVKLIPTPTADQLSALTVHCSYLPTRDADRVDALLLDEYREAIVSGALSRLLRMSKEPWYDPLEARERQDWFAIAISEARSLADKDFHTGEQRVHQFPMA